MCIRDSPHALGNLRVPVVRIYIGLDDGNGISEPSSSENADPKSHTPVKKTFYLTEVSPSPVQNPMVDPEHNGRPRTLQYCGFWAIAVGSNRIPRVSESVVLEHTTRDGNQSRG